MQLKTVLMMALSLLLGGASLVGDAKGRTGSALDQASDLEAVVQIFEDQDGQTPIPNGARISNKSVVWARFTVTNKGLVGADRFTLKAVVSVNDVKMAAPAAETITLASHQSRTLPMVKINTSGRSGQVSARMIADIGNFVRETNETNNKMEMRFRVENNF